MFLGKDPADETYEWKEWMIQAFIVMMARRAGYIVHGDQNGASKTAKGQMEAQLSALAGWPDLCFILASGPLWIELKRKGGKLSKEQKQMHQVMLKSNCRVEVVVANSPAHGWELCRNIIL